MLQRWLVVIIGLPLLLAALLLCPDWATVIVVCGIAAAAAYELLHTAGKKVPKCVYAATILAAVALEWVIYSEHAWQFYDGYQSVGMIRILCVPLALVTVLFFIAVTSYGKPSAMPFADVATAIVGGVVFPMMYSTIFLLRMDPSTAGCTCCCLSAWHSLGTAFHVRRNALRQTENGPGRQPPQNLGRRHCRTARRRAGAGALGRGGPRMAWL